MCPVKRISQYRIKQKLTELYNHYERLWAHNLRLAGTAKAGAAFGGWSAEAS